MAYRKYQKMITAGALVLSALFITGCAGAERKPGSLEKDEDKKAEEAERRIYRYDGREPASARSGDITWLNEVEEDFGRIAAETSSRTVASNKNREVLVAHKRWTFQYAAGSNQFFVNMGGSTWRMVQTNVGDSDLFSFAAEGQADNPVTFSVGRVKEGRVPASVACEAELQFWNKGDRAYQKDRAEVRGDGCEKLLSRLKSYVP
ncbi:MAG: hypothetical protein HUU37_07630 [Bdellovibrionales bacterium]|nr:hypothetical protein [Bdellovibrionales bacterium]